MKSLDPHTINQLLVGSEKSIDESVEIDFSLNPVDELQIAWSAGFLDGEGAVMITKSSPSPKNPKGQVYLVVKAVQKTEAPICKLHLMYGGTIKFVSNRNQWEWRVFGDRASTVLRMMRPYLIVKSVHADIAIEFQETCIGSNVPFSTKVEYWSRIAKLQMKGQHMRKNAVS